MLQIYYLPDGRLVEAREAFMAPSGHFKRIIHTLWKALKHIFGAPSAWFLSGWKRLIGMTLGVNVANMRFNRVEADMECGGDRLIAIFSLQQQPDFRFPIG
jgi:hypothetical protein